MKNEKIVKNFNSSRLPWEEAAAPKGSAAHSLETTALIHLSIYILIQLLIHLSINEVINLFIY